MLCFIGSMWTVLWKSRISQAFKNWNWVPGQPQQQTALFSHLSLYIFHRYAHLILYISCWCSLFPVHITAQNLRFLKISFLLHTSVWLAISWPLEADLLFPGGHFSLLHFLRCYPSFIVCGFTVLSLGGCLFVLCGFSILCNLKFAQCFLLRNCQPLNSLQLLPHSFNFSSHSSLFVLIYKISPLVLIDMLLLIV